ncbi:sigma-70 family RNA polymerase sigma factor [Comamonas antarctica]|uniref:sigma-70 family RNA polymerase sigma factor n=1 Tax=Comamonas antarctica TaxID=2743470 RepID=UPI001FC82AC3|nr:sigma-70 family RNA polymerase sigma factor [Comamonas antarctica]
MPVPCEDFNYEAALLACAAGERAALQRLYEQEAARLLAVVRRIVRDGALAEDVLHDAWVNIWTRATSFDPARGSARGWIYSVARNLALNARRDDLREADLPQETLQVLDDQASLAAWDAVNRAGAWADSAGRVGHCLSELEPVRRDCILYAYVDGLTQKEIAARVSAPLGTVKAWIQRSLVALRACMS